MNLRRQRTAEYYLEGDTVGNLTQSMIKAGYSKSYAENRCDRMYRDIEFNKEIDRRKAEIDAGNADRAEVISKNFENLRLRCIKAKDRVNEARCLESQAKHDGWYGKDNAQQVVEQAKLTQREREEAQRIANIRLRQG